jgi:threonine dehydrogenase-like Zn-dependent dehydrogenase
LATAVLELTDGRGVDHVIEVVGRLEPSVHALAMEERSRASACWNAPPASRASALKRR